LFDIKAPTRAGDPPLYFRGDSDVPGIIKVTYSSTATANFRAMNISGVTVTLGTNLTISGGRIRTSYSGSGIAFSGANNTLTIDGAIITDNEADYISYANHNGNGAVSITSGTVIFKSGKITGNHYTRPTPNAIELE
jgi:hypothetical protein